MVVWRLHDDEIVALRKDTLSGVDTGISRH
jgi:hypothetical protein